MKKIMFNDRYGLTDAVLSRRKTMTRRIIKGDFEYIKAYHANGGWHFIADTKDGDSVEVKPAYEIGEKVAVAQTYESIAKNHRQWLNLQLAANDEHISKLMDSAGWQNKMFVSSYYLPHRIRITDIKIQRLQEITDIDCLQEGIIECKVPDSKRKKLPFALKRYKYFNQPYMSIRQCDTPTKAFAALIDKISGKGTWHLNPWVFVYEFKLIK